MEANSFVVRLKANGTEKDLCDLNQAYTEFKLMLSNLGAQDKGIFALNVLCTLCRNLDKVPSWKDRVDGRILVILTIESAQETDYLPRADQVKVLACIYHIHKHVIKLTSAVPPELVLKLSFISFKSDVKCLLEEYSKTYWNIIVDRLSYIEKLKSKTSISKLLPKTIEDILKVIQIYDSVQFCINIVTYLVKKLHLLFNDTNTKELQQCFSEIFKVLSSKTDLASFKKLKPKELLDVYVKFNECFYVIAENASRCKFEICLLHVVVRSAITILGHHAEIMRCLETFFLNGFCSIFENLTNAINIENVLNNMLASCSSLEKLEYEKTMYITYSFLNQFLRLYVEFVVSNTKLDWNLYFHEAMQLSCFKLMLYLSSKKCEQFLKCDNCTLRSGLHDSLRLLFLIKHFPVGAINQKLDITKLLPVHYKLVTIQHKILYELKRLGCANHQKCFRKLQTDVHNTAIALNKANYYEYSIKLFKLYIEYEICAFKDATELKNISRALYNKSICELDGKLYYKALKDAYLSLMFSLPEGLGSEKCMSLVMDIKAKSLKSNEGEDEIQLASALEICKKCLDEKLYGNLKPFFVNIKFSEVLKHEFKMYAKLWPSIVPIAGVWMSLYDLLKKDHGVVDNSKHLKWTLFEVIFETVTVVRTVHSKHYVDIVDKLLEMFESEQDWTTESHLVHAAILFLRCEYDLAEASQTYKWKSTEPSMDPDQVQTIRTIPQEHEASKKAIEAVHILSKSVKNIDAVGRPLWLHSCLQLYQVFVYQLLLLARTVPALHLAHVCCLLAKHIEDSEAFIRNASVLLSHASESGPEMMQLITDCSYLWSDVSLQTAICFMCDAAIYLSKSGSIGAAARLVQMAQSRILEAHESNQNVMLDIAVGRLTEAQAQLCGGINALSVVSGVQRHYLAAPNNETKWTSRRLLALILKVLICASSMNTTSVCRSLLLWRRARCACAACLPVASAVVQAKLYATITNVHKMDDAQTKIDNRLKHILGLQPSNESQLYKTEPSKPQLFTPRHENLETMLEDHVFKKTQSSPSLPCTSVYAYKTPEFLKHDNCECAVCDNPYSYLIACMTFGLESSMYYRAKEMDIARNYFEGTIKSFGFAESKLRSYFKRCKGEYAGYVVDMVEKIVYDEFKSVQIEVLIEAAFFELSQKNFERADDYIVRVHEILQDMMSPSAYLRNDVMNLMTTSAQMRKATVNPVETGLEVEMESLKLSPGGEPPKTPVNKVKVPPKITKNVVKDEELPSVKRKVIKLNLDEAHDEKETKKPVRKRGEFKIPVPITTKPVLESITPRHTRSKPEILISKPSDDVKMTPNVDNTDFFTPKSTPAEEFFTPMSTLKTYSKKSLRSNIVKNLEAEFSTPKADKENSILNAEANLLEVPNTSGRPVRSKVDKKTLKRATSPGKLVKEVKPTRSRLRNPVGFKVHEDNGK